MEEKTADEIAAIFSAAGDSVTVINTAKTSEETDDEYKDKIKRNVDHLEIIKAYKKQYIAQMRQQYYNTYRNGSSTYCATRSG